MNVNAYLIDDNKYLITNEDGDIRLAQKNKKLDLNQEVLAQILKKENIIEKAERELHEKERCLKSLKNSNATFAIMFFKLMNVLTNLTLYFYFIKFIPVVPTIFITLITYIGIKTFEIAIFDTTHGRKRKKEALTQEISNLNLDLNNLYKQLEEMKKIIEFEEIYTPEELNKKIEPIIYIEPELKINPNKPKTRVLRLEK